MAFTFPTSPSIGQQYSVAGGPTYTYNGTAWVVLSPGSQFSTTAFTATASQTTFSVPSGYIVGSIEVYRNGVRYQDGVDYTATNGSTVVLTVGASLGDTILVVRYAQITYANALPLSGGALSGSLNATTITANTGLYSVGTFGGTYSDGIVLDYTAGTGRISVGTGDGLGFYSNGVANTALMTLDASGNLSATSFSGAHSGAGAFTTLSASSTVSGTGFSSYLASPPAIGGTTPAAGAFTTLSASSTVTLSGGTANGVLYLNGSKVATSGSALTFDGSTLTVTTDATFGYALTDANRFINIIGAGAARDFGLKLSGSRVLWQNTGTSGLIFGQSDTEQMRLTPTGLGIGTSSPGAKLDVAALAGGILRLTSTQTSASPNDLIGKVEYYSMDGDGAHVGAYVGAYQDPIDAYGRATYLAFGTNPTAGAVAERMRLDSSGNLGLGVTPSVGIGSGLKVLEIGNSGMTVHSRAVNTFELSQGAYNAGGAVWKYANSSYGVNMFEMQAGGYYWFTAPSGTAGSAISFTQAMTLDASGNLLVGDTSYRLSGITAAGQAIQFGSRTFIGTSPVGDTALGGLSGSNYTALYANGSERMRIDSSGNVGIGTSSPANKLDVNNTSGATTGGIRVYATDQAYARLNVQNANGQAYHLVAGTPGASNSGFAIYDATAGATRVQLDSSGNVGIGTSSPQSKLGFSIGTNTVIGQFASSTHQSGNVGSIGIGIGDGSGPGVYSGVFVNNTFNGTFCSQDIRFFTAQGGISVSTERMRLDSSGNLLVGTTSGSYKITCNGQPGANGYTAWTNYSDARLKENVVSFEGGLAEVIKLRPVSFNYNELSGYDEQTRARIVSGFIAQELQKVCPDMVGTTIIDDVEYLDTNTSNLNLLLVKAIQELKAELDELKTQLGK